MVQVLSGLALAGIPRSRIVGLANFVDRQTVFLLALPFRSFH
jgi:hypothetical protein